MVEIGKVLRGKSSGDHPDLIREISVREKFNQAFSADEKELLMSFDTADLVGFLQTLHQRYDGLPDLKALPARDESGGTTTPPSAASS